MTSARTRPPAGQGPSISLGRSPRWHRWLALFAVVCAVSLYSIEATHFHHTLAEQQQCPAGHAVGHSPGNVFTPEFAATLLCPQLRDRSVPHASVARIGNPPYFIPHSHAPPFLIA